MKPSLPALQILWTWATRYGLFACCLATFAVVAVGAILHKGLTYDENNFLHYGAQIVFNHSTARQINSVMPASALNLLLVKLYGSPSLTVARSATILFSMLTAIIVFRWALELYGLPAGYLAGLLYLCCPNILAHSGLATLDIYAAGTILIAMYCFWRFMDRPGLLRGLWSAASLGLALLAKFTCVALFPICLIIAAIRYGCALPTRLRTTPNPGARILKDSGIAILTAVFFAALIVTVINAGNLFEATFVPLAEFGLRSPQFSTLLNQMPWLGVIPMPVAFSWFQGLDWVLATYSVGEQYLYLFGELRHPADGPFTGYYFLVSLFKVPIATQLILLAAGGVMLWRRRDHDWLKNELFLLVPVFYFFYFFNFSMRAQVGLRHFLVVFPLLFVLAGSLLAPGRTFCGRHRYLVIGLLLVWQLASVASFYPHVIPYVNEFVTDRKLAYKLFADSNLAWGGDEYYLKQYLAAHPEALYAPKAPTAGTIVVELNDLVGLLDSERFEWLRQNFEPVDTLAGGSYLVYQVAAERLPQPQAPNEAIQ